MEEKTTNRTERAFNGTLVSFLQYGLQMLLQAFLAPLVLCLAGQETLGAYALLIQVYAYIAMLDLGFSATLTRFLANARGYQDEGRRFRDVISTARTFLLGSNTCIAILTFLLSYQIDTFFTMTPAVAAQARLGLVILALWTVLKTPWSVYGIGLNATQNLAAYNFAGIIGNVSRLIFSLILVYGGAGLVGLMLANVLADAGSAIFATRYFSRLHPQLKPAWGLPNKGLFREMMVFSLQALLINIAWRLVYYTDNIVIGYLYGAAAVSIYYTTQIPTTIGFNIANRVSDNAAPAINELFARGEEAKLRTVFLKLHRYNFLLVMPLVAGLLVLNQDLITLWVGAAQYAGDQMTYALAGFALLITTSHVSGVFVIASGKIRLFSYIAILEGLVNLGLSLFLGRIIGIPGVIIATVIANIPTTAYLLVVTMRRFKVSAQEYLNSCILPLLLPIGAGYVANIFMSRWMDGVSWASFLLQGSGLVIVYGIFVFRLGLDKTERSWLEEKLLYLLRKRRKVELEQAG